MIIIWGIKGAICIRERDPKHKIYVFLIPDRLNFAPPQPLTPGDATAVIAIALGSIAAMVKVGRNALELSSWTPEKHHLAFLGPKFTKFLP